MRALTTLAMVCLFAGILQAQPITVNQLGELRTITETGALSQFNPSDPGFNLSDILGDGTDNYLLVTSTPRNLRDPDSEFGNLSVLIEYLDGEQVPIFSFEGLLLPGFDVNEDGTPDLLKAENGVLSFSSFTLDNDVAVEEAGISVGFLEYEFADDLISYPSNDGVLVCGAIAPGGSVKDCFVVSLSGGLVSAEPLGVSEDVARRFTSTFLHQDLNGDGSSEVVLFNTPSFPYEGDVTVYERNPDRTFSSVSTTNVGSVINSGSSIRLFAADVNADGNVELLFSSNREFGLGFVQIFFSPPVCYVSTLLNSENPLGGWGAPVTVDNNCVFDRVIPPTAGVDDPTKPSIVTWRDGNITIHNGLDPATGDFEVSDQVNDDQTIFPRPGYWDKPLSAGAAPGEIGLFRNGEADPATVQRGIDEIVLEEGGTSIALKAQPRSRRRRSRKSERRRIREARRIAREAEEAAEAVISAAEFFNTGNGVGIRTSTINGAGEGQGENGVSESNPDFLFVQDPAFAPGDQTPTIGSGDPISRPGTPNQWIFASQERVIITDTRAFATSPKLSLQNTGDDTLSVNTTIDIGAIQSFDDGGRVTVANIGDIDNDGGDDILVGSGFSTDNFDSINKLWVYLSSNTTFAEPDIIISLTNDTTITTFSNNNVGGVAEALGDVNGDGFNDFGIGLTNFYSQAESSGGVYIFFGADFSEPAKVQFPVDKSSPDLILVPAVNEEFGEGVFNFGSSISGGDFNGDGFNDVAVLHDFSNGSPPTIQVFDGGADMDGEADRLLFVTREDVGGTNQFVVSSTFDGVVAFMPKEAGSDHQDLYYSPGGFSGLPDAVIFTGGVTTSTIPNIALRESGSTPTGMGTFERFKPAVADFNNDGFYDIMVVKQFDGRDGAISSRMLYFSPNSGLSVSVDEENEIIDAFSLEQNFPNPFNPSTNIQFELPVASNVTLKIFNILGQEVATLVNNERLTAGTQVIPFNASNLASGVYLYRIEAGNFIRTRKMTLIK